MTAPIPIAAPVLKASTLSTPPMLSMQSEIAAVDESGTNAYSA